jgi:hypothetical protein
VVIEHPKVFISHASEDKERFVTDFATKLRASGIDAWVDRWEMLPGDSLIDKVFEEGIKNAQAMIVILSKYSLQKRWVREELNAGMVRRISGKYKIIPVLLDDCEVPEALRSTVWEKIANTKNYEKEFDHIISAIYGITQKPPLGYPPNYSRLQIDNISDLSQVDSVIFKAICAASLEIGFDLVNFDWVNTGDLRERISDLGITDAVLHESLDLLAELHFIEKESSFSSQGLDIYQITALGFERYATAFVPGFDNLVSQVLICIVNDKMKDNVAITASLAKPYILINYILDILQERGLVKLKKTIDNVIHIMEITGQGKLIGRNLSNSERNH